MYGYAGKILRVNLTTGKIEKVPLDPALAKKYIGGSTLAAKLLFQSGAFGVDALSSDNPLIFMTGPLTGTTLPGSSRFELVSKSPLTGAFGAASCGGDFGPELKFAGYDGIVIAGASEGPVYLWIKDDRVELLDAKELWRKDTFETDDLIKKINQDPNIKTASIGAAGENLVLYACVVISKQDVAGRCGLGAVMGSKKLKAIAIRGSGRPRIYDPKKYNVLRKELFKKIKETVTSQTFHDYGTDATMQMGMMVCDVPTKNWRMAVWEEGADRLNGIRMAETILTGRRGCFACPINCKREVEVKVGPYKIPKGPGPEYETCAAFGTLLLNSDLESVAFANRLCNRYGMDTIATGSVIAFSIECFERGILTEKDTRGLKLRWGDAKLIIELIEMIALQEGLGELMAEGTRRMSEKLGHGSEEFAIHSKGLDVPMHDPRAYHSLALAYSTSPRGACHIRHLNLPIEMGISRYPAIGIDKKYKPLSSQDKAQMTVKSENLGMISGSCVLCQFVVWSLSSEEIRAMLNCTTGMNWTLEEMMAVGERSWYIQRSFGNLCGLTSKDDTLPKRLLMPHLEGKPTGLDKIIFQITKLKPPEISFLKTISLRLARKTFPLLGKMLKLLRRIAFFGGLRGRALIAKGSPDLGFMLKEYYEIRKLNEHSFPDKEKLISLGLQDAAEKLEKIERTSIFGERGA